MSQEHDQRPARRRLEAPPEPDEPCHVPAGARLLDGRVAVVTGAGAGIGAGIAKAVAWQGARPVLVDTDPSALQRTAAAIDALGGPAAALLVLDVTTPEAPAAVAAAAADLGGADLLVNNVGDFRPSGPFLTSGPGDWERMYRLNFGHVLAVTHALLPGMVSRSRGAILNVSSVEGMRGIPGNVRRHEGGGHLLHRQPGVRGRPVRRAGQRHRS